MIKVHPVRPMIDSKTPFVAPPDALLVELSSFAAKPLPLSESSLQAAAHCVLDSLGIVMLAQQVPDCARWLGPAIPGTQLPLGARLPGTDFELQPSTAAFDLALCLHWLGLQCLWSGEELISPADPLAPILATADWLGRSQWHAGQLKAYGRLFPVRDKPLTMLDVFSALVCAQEIQGALAEANCWQSLGLDRSVLSRVASAASVTRLLGGDQAQIYSAISLAWQAGVRPFVDLSRVAWNAAAEAEQAVSLSLHAMAGNEAIPQVLSMPRSGFQDACHGGRVLHISRPLGSTVSEQLIYNLVHPEILAAQTATEAALKLYPMIADRVGDIERVDVATHAAALEIEQQPCLPARHSLVRAIAASLAHGRLNHELFRASADAPLRELRSRIQLREDPVFTADSHNPDKRSLAGSVQVFLRDGTHTERITIEYPIGHYRRRTEGVPLLFSKAESAIAGRFDEARTDEILDLFDRQADLAAMPVANFVDLWV